jgi:hypothetical protein
MDLMKLVEIWEAIAASRRAVLLITLATVAAVIPLAYCLIPERYQVKTEMVIPYTKSIDLTLLNLAIKGEILEKVYQQTGLRETGLSLWKVERDLAIMYDSEKKQHHFYFVGNNAGRAVEFINRLNLETLAYARDLLIANLEEQIEESRRRIVEIEAIMDDDFFAAHYETLFAKWRELLQLQAGSNIYVLVDFDSELKELYLEKKSLQGTVDQLLKAIESYRALTDEDFAAYFKPAYRPDYRMPPRPLFVSILAVPFGLLLGVSWAIARRYGAVYLIGRGKAAGR